MVGAHHVKLAVGFAHPQGTHADFVVGGGAGAQVVGGVMHHVLRHFHEHGKQLAAGGLAGIQAGQRRRSESPMAVTMLCEK
jgi:hypothetical protein